MYVSYFPTTGLHRFAWSSPLGFYNARYQWILSLEFSNPECQCTLGSTIEILDFSDPFCLKYTNPTVNDIFPRILNPGLDDDDCFYSYKK